LSKGAPEPVSRALFGAAQGVRAERSGMSWCDGVVVGNGQSEVTLPYQRLKLGEDGSDINLLINDSLRVELRAECSHHLLVGG
jgi:hypothetical protein